MSLRVLLVDDEELARFRLRGLVNECLAPKASVVGEAASVPQALVWLAAHPCEQVFVYGRCLIAQGAADFNNALTTLDYTPVAGFDANLTLALARPGG